MQLFWPRHQSAESAHVEARVCRVSCTPLQPLWRGHECAGKGRLQLRHNRQVGIRHIDHWGACSREQLAAVFKATMGTQWVASDHCQGNASMTSLISHPRHVDDVDHPSDVQPLTTELIIVWSMTTWCSRLLRRQPTGNGSTRPRAQNYVIEPEVVRLHASRSYTQCSNNKAGVTGMTPSQRSTGHIQPPATPLHAGVIFMNWTTSSVPQDIIKTNENSEVGTLKFIKKSKSLHKFSKLSKIHRFKIFYDS